MMSLFLNSVWENPGVILALLVAAFGLIALIAFLIKKFVINPKSNGVKEEKEKVKSKEDIAEEELNRVLEDIEDEEVAGKVKEYNEKED